MPNEKKNNIEQYTIAPQVYHLMKSYALHQKTKPSTDWLGTENM